MVGNWELKRLVIALACLVSKFDGLSNVRFFLLRGTTQIGS